MSTQKVSNAMIADMDAGKLTGALPAGMSTDTTSIENDIAVLALQNAVNSNMTAHSLQNNWIEQFEDSNSITSLSNTSRNANEYMTSSVLGSTFTLYGPLSSGVGVGNGWNNYHTRQRLTLTQSAGRIRFVVTSNVSSGELVKATFGQLSGTHGSYNYDTTATPTEILWGGSSGSTGADQTSDWLDFPVSSGSYVFCATNGNNNNIYYYTGSIPTADNYDSGAHSSSDFAPDVADVPVYSGNDYGPRMYFMSKIEGQTYTFNSTGSFTSTTITPQDSASKSSLGLCLLYKNQAGTNTLNTDIIAKVSADNGSNYSTCVLASKGTFSTGINIAIAPAISVTAGTQLKYKIEFANQASGSKEGRIHGIALQY